MLYQVKVYDKNMKLKKIISEKDVQKQADERFKEGHSPQKNAARYRAANGLHFSKISS